MLMAVWTGSACFHGDDYNDGDGDNDGDEVIIVILEQWIISLVFSDEYEKLGGCVCQLRECVILFCIC